MYTKFRLINEYCLLQVQSLWLNIQLLLLKTLIIVYALLDPSIKVILLYYILYTTKNDHNNYNYYSPFHYLEGGHMETHVDYAKL